MGIFDHLIERRTLAASDDFWYGSVSGGAPTNSGVKINDETAMRCATVYACVQVLAGSVMSLPVHLYRRLPDGGKERATNHPLHRLIHDDPHPRMTSPQFFETMMFHLALTGNHYSEKVLSKRGDLAMITPWNPHFTEVRESKSGAVEYVLKLPDGSEKVRPPETMLHIPALSWNGLTGLSPIAYSRETIGIAAAAEEFEARFFGSGTNMGHIMSPKEGIMLTQEQLDKFKEDLRKRYEGLGNSHKLLVAPVGMNISNVGIPPKDAEFLELRKFQKAEIASIFRVPLILLQEHEKNTSWGTGIEQMMIAFVTYTLRPWLVRIERSLNKQLLGENERERFFFEFLVDGLLRGDSKARSEYYSAALVNKWMTPNEVRSRDNLNPVEGGDEFNEPQNIYGGGGAQNQEKPKDTKSRSSYNSSGCQCGHEWWDHDRGHSACTIEGCGCKEAKESRADDTEYTGARQNIQRSYIRIISDSMSRVLRRERNDVLANAKKLLRRRGVSDLSEWISEFYVSHEEFTREQMEPAFESLAEAIGAEAMREIGQEWAWNDELRTWIAEYIAVFAANQAARSRGQLLALLEETDPAEVLNVFQTRFDEWDGDEEHPSRADKIARDHAVRLGQAFSAATWFGAGVAALVWRNTGAETCPYCKGLNGRRVSSGESFLSAGEDYKPKGAEAPLRPSTNVKNPPVHGGCDCILVPG